MKHVSGTGRRTILKSMLAAPGLVLVGRGALAKDALPKLKESDPAAKALAYHHDADSIDSADVPDRGSNEYCRNCNFIKGTSGDQWRPCEIFPQNRVNADGWCKNWTESKSIG